MTTNEIGWMEAEVSDEDTGCKDWVKTGHKADQGHHPKSFDS
jgi:hypothetical protein